MPDNDKLSLRERKKQQTRNRILDAARDLFELHGFDETAIEQIAERAEVSRGTFFNYFSTKDGLLGELADQELTSLEHRVETQLASIPTAVAKIRQTMHMLVNDTLPFMRVTRHVLLDALQHAANKGQEATNVRLGDILRQLVIEAQSQDEIRSDRNPDEIALAITGAYMAAIFGQMPPGSSVTAHALPMVENIVDMLFEGIAGPCYPASETKNREGP